jgi:hypothetical protein
MTNLTRAVARAWSTWTCSHCGRNNPYHYLRCGQCGRPIK